LNLKFMQFKNCLLQNLYGLLRPNRSFPPVFHSIV
jgi:hypothetical protein